MKVLWIVLGVVGGLCLLCGGGIAFLVFRGKGAFDEAGAYGDQAFRAIAANWDSAELESRAAPEISAKNGRDAISNLCARYREQLGPLKGEFSSTLNGLRATTNNGVGATYADWNASATFEKGSGTVHMTLINRDGKWQIWKFTVESAALGQPRSGEVEETQPDEPNLPPDTETR